jgi:hypothetical protein
LSNFAEAEKNYRADVFCERMFRVLEGH